MSLFTLNISKRKLQAQGGLQIGTGEFHPTSVRQIKYAVAEKIHFESERPISARLDKEVPF